MKSKTAYITSTAKRPTSAYHKPMKKVAGFRDYTETLYHVPMMPQPHYKDYSKCIKLYVKPLDASDPWYYEALVLESGAVLIGTDVFRLIIHDTPSHKMSVFKTMDEVLEKYRIVERNYY